jgi:RHS repeat-associated protein
MKFKQLFTARTYSDSSTGPQRQASVRYFFIRFLLFAAIVLPPVSGITATGNLDFGEPWDLLKRWKEEPVPYSYNFYGMYLFDGEAFYEDYLVGQWVDLGYGSAGDSITWRMISPQGNIQDSTLHWVEDGGFWRQLRNFQVYEWGPEWRVADGVFSPDEIGLWHFELLHNDKVVHTDQFELIPRTLVKSSDASPTVIVNEDGSYNHVVLSVKLIDFDGVNPAAGETVSFSVRPPKGSKGGGVNPSSIRTNAAGIASVNFVPGSKSGKYIVEASTPSAITTTQTFTVTVSHGQQDYPDPDYELIDNKNEGEPVDEAQGEIDSHVEELEVVGGICPKVGNPINIGNGNKYQKERDFVTKGSFPLTFVRHYNSLANENTSMGAHWRSNYHRSLEKIKEGKGKKAPWVVMAHRHNGKTYQFRQSDDGSWIGDPDVSDNLEEMVTGWRYTTRRGLVEIYNEAGELTKLIAANGHEQQLLYDGADKLQQIQDGFGKSIIINYSAGNLIDMVTDPAGGVYRYAHDASGNLSQITYPDATTRHYLYENVDYPHAMTGIVDENGQRYATWIYEVEGRAIHSEHAGGSDALDISYQANGKRTTTDTSGSVSTYQVISLHGTVKVAELTKEQCADCGIAFSQQTTYDSNGYPKFRIDADGNETSYYYNERGLLEGQTKGFGSTQEQRTNIVWHSKFNVPLAVHKEAFSTYFTYDQSGKLLEKRKTDNITRASRKWVYTYNEQGLIATLDGPRTDVNDVTTYSYYADGNLSSIANSIYTEITYLSYDAFGRPLEQLDENGVLTQLEYDSRGRLIRSETAGEVTLFQYDNAGNVTKIVGPDGRENSYRYDEAGRLIEQGDGRGNIIQFTLDPEGNRIGEVSRNAFQSSEHTHGWSYDPLGFMVGDQGAQGQTTSYAYDSGGNLVSRTDANSRTIQFGYGALDKLTTTTYPDGGVVTNSYDDAGNLTRVTDPLGNSTLYSYNGFGEQVEFQSPDAGVSSSDYDKAGNVVTKNHANGTSVTSQYDALNRLVQSTYSDGSVITYSYDSCQNGVSRLCSISTDSTRVSWKYDDHGRVVEESRQVGSINLVTGATYNVQGQLLSLIYPSGKVLAYQYTDTQLTGLTFDGLPVVSGVAYNALEQISSWTWGNGTQHTRTYDQDGQLIQHSIGNLDRALSYDLLGNITTMVDAENDRQFEYDEMQRIVSAIADDFDLGLTYDLNGNRLSAMEAPGTDTYSYDSWSNRLAQVTGVETKIYQYDETGNILSDGIRTFGYDARNRLVTVDGDAATYTYDALGQRVAKNHNGTVSYFVYAENGSLTGEYDQTGQALQDPLYLNGMPVAVMNIDGLYNIHSDHLNTPRYITDQADTLVWKWDSKPFGDTPADEDPDGNGQRFTYNIRFPGQYYDQETGLHYNYFRDYDPSTGRYIESDPIGLDGGLNTYLYVNANPLRYTDPMGLDNVGCTTDPLTIDGRCKRICCAIHDKCYDDSSCTSDSWISDSGCNADACDKCNYEVSKCFVWCDQAEPMGMEPAPGTPEYYCPAQHRYIKIPGDFPSVGAAKAVCGS